MININDMENEKLIILGLDPGTQITGYGVISLNKGDILPVDFGAIYPPKKETDAAKYHVIFQSIVLLIERYKPDVVSIETQFFCKNVQSALKLGMAKAACMIAAAEKKIQVAEYAPRKAKQAVVGNGAASKEQVKKMVQILLKLPEPPHPEDAADALALAICHAHSFSFFKGTLI
ncbi:MAG: crossover junction endodeoxyribonuclease RuvC [Rhabdochlamydiaceae bacterium]